MAGTIDRRGTIPLVSLLCPVIFDRMSPLVDLSIVFLLILINGVFVVSEMAIVSARKVRLQQAANNGDRRAGIALELASAPGRFLPTVQVGITLMAILSGARGESAISNVLRPILEGTGFGRYAEVFSSTIAIIIITYLTIVIGELVPKQIALNGPEKLAKFVASPMNFLSWLATPINIILGKSTDIMLKVLNIRPSSEPEITEEEIKVMIGEGTKAGTFELEEQNMMERVMRLGDRKIGALMTPRLEVIWLNLEDSLADNRRKIVDSAYSRFPVCQGELDRVLGVIHVADLLSQCLTGTELDFTNNTIQPLFIPENTKGLKVLEQFKESGTHIAMIVDEYGVIQGLVTLNDLLEAIVGDIADIEQPEAPQIFQREDGSWLLDGMLPIEEFLTEFNLPDNAIDRQANYLTLGGFTIHQLGKVPATGDIFEWETYQFEIVDMDGNRVDKILLKTI
jgi:putative hemolysin